MTQRSPNFPTSLIGVRYHLRNLLPAWRERNPQVDVVTSHSQFEHPELSCYFRSGEVCTQTLKNLTARQIEDLLSHFRNSDGPNLHLKHGGPRVWTERRSIQGLWQPSAGGMVGGAMRLLCSIVAPRWVPFARHLFWPTASFWSFSLDSLSRKSRQFPWD